MQLHLSAGCSILVLHENMMRLSGDTHATKPVMKAMVLALDEYVLCLCGRAASGLSFVASLLLTTVLLFGITPSSATGSTADTTTALFTITGDTIADLRAIIPVGDKWPDTRGFRLCFTDTNGVPRPYYGDFWVLPSGQCLIVVTDGSVVDKTIALEWREQRLVRSDGQPYFASDRFLGLVNTTTWNDDNCMVEPATDADSDTLRVRLQVNSRLTRIYIFTRTTMELRSIEYWRGNEFSGRLIVQNLPASAWPGPAGTRD